MWRRRSIDVSPARPPWGGLALVAIVCGGLGCAPRAAPPLLLVVRPAPFIHQIGSWPDTDLVCVGVPVMQALYVTQRCVSMGAIRSLILTAQVANEAPAR